MINMSLSQMPQMPQMQMNAPGEKPVAKFSMKKLPMWGRQVNAEEINFEWPTEQMVREFP